MMSTLTGCSWKLDRYARFVYNANEAGENGEWKESHSLARAWSWMRGLSRNDSLLFIYKFKEETRRFRVRFSKEGDVSGIEVCTKVVQQLAHFFPIKMSPAGSGTTDRMKCDDKTTEKNSDTMQSEAVIPNKEMKSSMQLGRDVTLGVITQTLLSRRHLPLAYHQHHENLDMIPQLVRMCLGDPTFPAFVESVEVALKAIVEDT